MSLYYAKKEQSGEIILKKIRDRATPGIYHNSKAILQIYSSVRTNGITYIPQDIKFEIVNGTTPTLHAGSEVWIPYGKAAPELSIGDTLNNGTVTAVSWDGVKLFYKVKYDTDLSIDITSDPARAEFVTSISPYHSFWWFYPNYSQDTAPSDFGPYALWYDTSENIVKITTDSGVTWQNYASLPVGVFTMAGAGATKKLKHVFNGFGYIGTTVFALPGIKMLMSNGIGRKNRFKNIKRTINTVISRNLKFNREKFSGVILNGRNSIDGENLIKSEELPTAPDGYVFCYRTSDNTLWFTENNNTWVKVLGTPIGWFKTSTSGILSFNPASQFIKIYQFESYDPQQILVNISNGQTANVIFYPGIYYVEAQGAGGSGGQYGVFGWGRGAGGGSGAGFKGYIRVKKTINSNITTAVTTPRAGGSASHGTTGGSTTISDMFLCAGGQGGIGADRSTFVNGGLITVYESPDFDIIQADYLGNGNPTDLTDLRRGGDSVITNDGGGRDSDATSPGAGGCGFDGAGLNGGAGGAGSCLIKYISYYGGPNVVIFAQPNLTTDTNGTPGGDSFAAFAESETSQQNGAAYLTFNGITVTDINNWVNADYHMPTWLAWYNPKPLKVSKLKIMHCIDANYNIKDFQVQVSETGSSSNSGEWETVYTGQNALTTAFSSFEVEIPDTAPASKYWRIYITSGTSTSNRSRVSIQDIRIYAEVEDNQR